MVHWTTTTALLLSAAAALPSSQVTASTWIDCIDTDRSVVYDKARDWSYGGERGNGLCRGYTKNYPGRGDPNIARKMTFKILMNDVAKGVPVCTSGDADYSGWRHRIQVKAGQKFYYGYLENGHVSKDKAGRGTFYGVYWTGVPGSNLDSTTALTNDKLIDGQLHDFDDGHCGESTNMFGAPSGRAGDGYPCVGNLMMPAGTKPGIYNLVWFWKFYDAKSNGLITNDLGTYGGAAYSSCFQVEVVAGKNAKAQSKRTRAPKQVRGRSGK